MALLEVVGWILILAGLAALVLPGPGLLMLFAGLVVLSQQYEWAERRLEPVERVAKRAAAEGVETWLRVALSTARRAGDPRVRGALDRRPGRARLVAGPRVVVADRRPGDRGHPGAVRLHRPRAAGLQLLEVPGEGRPGPAVTARISPMITSRPTSDSTLPSGP